MFERGAGPSESAKEPERHGFTLGTLTCHVCGAGPFVECDITTHQDYANARYPCTVCGAVAGEVCDFDCPAADTVLRVLMEVTPDHSQPHATAW